MVMTILVAINVAESETNAWESCWSGQFIKPSTLCDHSNSFSSPQARERNKDMIYTFLYINVIAVIYIYIYIHDSRRCRKSTVCVSKYNLVCQLCSTQHSLHLKLTFQKC